MKLNLTIVNGRWFLIRMEVGKFTSNSRIESKNCFEDFPSVTDPSKNNDLFDLHIGDIEDTIPDTEVLGEDFTTLLTSIVLSAMTDR